jgi:uncharacterized RDD family membrane protein YckC
VQDFDLIETPENVELQRRLAGIGSRYLAGFLDSLIILFIILTLLTLLLLTSFDVSDLNLTNTIGKWLVAFLTIIIFLIYWGYYVLFEIWTNGQSPGKKIIKIRVVQTEGGGISFSAIAIRNLLRIIDIPLAIVVMFITQKTQRLGDLAAGTVVISEELLDYSSRYDKKKKVIDNVSITSDTLEASGLKPEEYRLLNNYWLRRSELNIEARIQLLPQLVRPILTRLGQTLPNESLEALEEYVENVLIKARSSGK